MKYIIMDLDRYDLSRSTIEEVESDLNDIAEFFEEYVGFYDDSVEILEDGNVLVVDGEENGFYVYKLI
tara:strand:+ start:454 stop:657 length:204 start_codon:yes stop_codon:yes gene_type:complete